jgi:hypothetical protein
VEPVAVGCIIRIFLRFVLEVEGLTTKGFTKVQTSCYLKTLEVRHQLLRALEAFLVVSQLCYSSALRPP